MKIHLRDIHYYFFFAPYNKAHTQYIELAFRAPGRCGRKREKKKQLDYWFGRLLKRRPVIIRLHFISLGRMEGRREGKKKGRQGQGWRRREGGFDNNANAAAG